MWQCKDRNRAEERSERGKSMASCKEDAGHSDVIEMRKNFCHIGFFEVPSLVASGVCIFFLVKDPSRVWRGCTRLV